jgi:hypothetical protein
MDELTFSNKCKLISLLYKYNLLNRLPVSKFSKFYKYFFLNALFSFTCGKRFLIYKKLDRVYDNFVYVE